MRFAAPILAFAVTSPLFILTKFPELALWTMK